MNEAERFLREQMNRQGASQSAPNTAPPLPPPQDHFNSAWAQANAYAAPTPSGPQRMVSMGEAFKRFWTRWTCQGRASLSEYWWAQLALFVVAFGVFFFLGKIAGASGNIEAVMFVQILAWIWDLAVFVPGLCLLVRRLHDTGHSGWCYFLLFIPLIGWIPLLIWLCRASEPRENQYGPVPNCS